MESRKNILYSRASQSLFTTTIAPMRVSSPIAAMGSSRQFGGAARAGGRISAFAQPRTSSQGPSRAALNIPTISMSMKGMNESETF